MQCKMVFVFITGCLTFITAGTKNDSIKTDLTNTIIPNENSPFKNVELKNIADNRLFFAEKNIPEYYKKLILSTLIDSNEIGENEIGQTVPMLVLKKRNNGKYITVPFQVLYLLKIQNKKKTIGQILDLFEQNVVESEITRTDIPFKNIDNKKEHF